MKNATHGNARPIRTSRTIVNIRMRCARTFTILAILTTSYAIGSPLLFRRLDTRTIHRGEFFFYFVSSNLCTMRVIAAQSHRVSQLIRSCNEKKREKMVKKLYERENRTRQGCQIWGFLRNYREINKRMFFSSIRCAG